MKNRNPLAALGEDVLTQENHGRRNSHKYTFFRHDIFFTYFQQVLKSEAAT